VEVNFKAYEKLINGDITLFMNSVKWVKNSNTLH